MRQKVNLDFEDYENISQILVDKVVSKGAWVTNPDTDNEQLSECMVVTESQIFHYWSRGYKL